MDFEPITTLRHRLQTYNSVVRNQRFEFMDYGSSSRQPAYTPYYERQQTIALFDALLGTGVEIPSYLWQDFIRAHRGFEEFEQEAGPAFRRLLLNELVSLVQAYQAALCYAFLGAPSAPHDRRPAEREIIGILISELKKDHDLAELERLVIALDETLAGIPEDVQESLPAANRPFDYTRHTAPVQCDREIF